MSGQVAFDEVSRRRFLRAAGGAAAGAVGIPLLAACVPATPAPPTRPAAVAPTTAAAANAVFPTYVPLSGGPKPTYAADGAQYSDGFDTYPANPLKSVPQPPGSGGTVNMMSIQLFPPPTPLEQNPAWQAVNKALNADVRFNIVTSADYPVKLGTIMAGSDLPDMMYMYARPGSASTLAAAAGVPQFLQAKAEDLTPYLAGDAAKDYPNLAAIPTSAWKYAGCAFQGRLYMLPIHRYLPGQMFVKNTTVWDRELGADYVPRNAEDFKRILLALTRQQEEFYGIGTGQGTQMMLPGFAAMFGAPNGWRLESDGKLVKDLETAEYKAAVGYARDLWAAGVVPPQFGLLGQQRHSTRAVCRLQIRRPSRSNQRLAGQLAAGAYFIAAFRRTAAAEIPRARWWKAVALRHRRSLVGYRVEERFARSHQRDAAHYELDRRAVRLARTPVDDLRREWCRLQRRRVW
jgi:putative aldouronate transport system substrate-binding protein